jgi:hypothetical protein
VTGTESKATHWLGAASGFLAGLAVLLIVGVLWQTFETTQAIRATQADSRESLALIKSCTTPEGACTQEGARRTGEAIAAITTSSEQLHVATRRYAAVAAACADRAGTQTTKQIASCIRKVIDNE